MQMELAALQAQLEREQAAAAERQAEHAGTRASLDASLQRVGGVGCPLWVGTRGPDALLASLCCFGAFLACLPANSAHPGAHAIWPFHALLAASSLPPTPRWRLWRASWPPASAKRARRSRSCSAKRQHMRRKPVLQPHASPVGVVGREAGLMNWDTGQSSLVRLCASFSTHMHAAVG